MEFWPHTLGGWIAVFFGVASMTVMGWVGRKLNPADAIVKHLDQISDDLDKRLEQSDPLEIEFQALEATVAEREAALRRVEQAKLKAAHGRVITGQMRCSHSRLHMVNTIGHEKVVFVCRDCKQVVKTSARPLE